MMVAEPSVLADPRVEEAVQELRDQIAGCFADATFHTELGESPGSVYLVVTVDLEDTEQVIDVVNDRLVALHVEEEVPVYVVAVRPPERVAASLEALRAHQYGSALLP